MTGRSRRHSPPLEQDDDAGLAGWLYTDLLLGLAVVFLAGTTFFVPKLLDDDKPAEAGTVTTTTTTIPVDLCTSLYAADGSQEDKTRGIWFTIERDRQSPENMAAEFDSKLRQQIDDENFSRIQQGLPAINYEGLRIGLMLVYGGFAADETPEQGQLRWLVGWQACSATSTHAAAEGFAGTLPGLSGQHWEEAGPRQERQGMT